MISMVHYDRIHPDYADGGIGFRMSAFWLAEKAFWVLKPRNHSGVQILGNEACFKF